MTSEPGQPLGSDAANLPPALPAAPVAPAVRVSSEPNAFEPIMEWARAIFGGIKDTAQQALDEGRHEANIAYDEGWRRFDEKTRFRRRNPFREE